MFGMRPYTGEREGGGWTGLVLTSREETWYISAAADGETLQDVTAALDAMDDEPIVNVHVAAGAGATLWACAARLGAPHLVALLGAAVERCPQTGASVSATVEERSYEIERTTDGLRLRGLDVVLHLQGPIVTTADRGRWLYLRAVTPPPPRG